MVRMTNKKEPTWITAKTGAAILTEKSGRPMNDRYIRRLAERGDIESKEITTRQNLYSREDIEVYKVRQRKKASDDTQPRVKAVERQA
jgi:hypothetical protein